MHRRALFTLLIVLSLPGSARAAPKVPTADWRADVHRYAQRMIDAGFFPGLAIAVTRGDSVVYVDGLGVADLETRRAVDESTEFYIASSTKALTATAVVLRAARGKLELTAPLSRALPGLRFKPPLRADSVTIGDLLSLTDGIEPCFPVVFRTAYSGIFTSRLLLRLLGECGPASTGRAFVYDNLPYNILGMVLSPTRRDGWKDVVRREVLEPLGMKRTTARLSRLDAAELAMPHELAPGGGFRRIRLAKGDANLHAAGGHFTTAGDLAKFVAAHASGGMLEGRRVFPAAAIASTHAKHADQDRDFGPYHRVGWGYGWDLGVFEGHPLIHRFGSFPGYRSHMSFMPDSGIGVVVLVNGEALPYAVDALANAVYDRLRTDAPGWAAKYDAVFRKLDAQKLRIAQRFAEALAQRKARQAPLPHPLRAYAGVYANPSLGTMRWRVSGGQLEVSSGIARSTAEVYAAAKNQLRVELTGGGEVVTFHFAASGGRATALEYHGYTFERVSRGR